MIRLTTSPATQYTCPNRSTTNLSIDVCILVTWSESNDSVNWRPKLYDKQPGVTSELSWIQSQISTNGIIIAVWADVLLA